MSEPGYQHFWRCAHHPISMQNFFDGLMSCEWGCHAQPLLWWHHGMHPAPPSWSDREPLSRSNSLG